MRKLLAILLLLFNVCAYAGPFEMSGGGGGTPAGTTGQIQYNNAGSFGGNFVLPATPGTTGDFLTSSGSASAAWTWTTPTTVGGTPAVGDLYYVSGTNTALTLADVAVGAILCSGGVTTAPSYCNSYIAKGTVPTMGACGTSPTIVGTDDAFVVTVGTGGSATTCAVTFALASTTNPRVCSVINDTDRVAYSTVESTTAITITATAAFTASSKFKVRCQRWL